MSVKGDRAKLRSNSKFAPDAGLFVLTAKREDYIYGGWCFALVTNRGRLPKRMYEEFVSWFKFVTRKTDRDDPAKVIESEPFDYQIQLATSSDLPIFLNVPTGSGKTTIALSWLWRRQYADEVIRRQTPRRLVICLPMRSLVEQTHLFVQGWLNAEKQWRQQQELPKLNVKLHMLMGGTVSDRWDADPESDCILIGTQDQLLSRALNRGYSMSRYRWTMPFALLNNDCLWVMDEVQLMGAGLRTTAQLQGFREKLQTYGAARSLWMSATLNPNLLQTADYQPDIGQIQTLTAQDRNNPTLRQRLQAYKPLQQASTVFEGAEDLYTKALVKEIASAHVPGSVTLVICNQVSRVQSLYRQLKKTLDINLLLVHSRFRAADRQRLTEQLHDKELSGIVVATQAVEAGIDLSARTLFTELAPWSSLVQRFGRCNRRGEYLKDTNEAAVYWIEMDLEKKGTASPYTVDELRAAQKLLQDDHLTQVSPDALETFLNSCSDKPTELEPEGLIPRKHDLLQLFDTSTDLAGHEIDISSFIRESDDTDVMVAWRNWERETPPQDIGVLQSHELCRVGLRSKQTKEFLDLLKQQKQVWIWDGLHGNWIKPERFVPGMMLLLPCVVGGYSKELGFTGDSRDKPEAVQIKVVQPDLDEGDDLAYIGYVTLDQHSQDTAKRVEELCEALTGYSLPIELLIEAGRWHDIGKNHREFQKRLTHNRPERKETIWAKSDHNWKERGDRYPVPEDRKGFRHELVSALVALQEGKEFLLAYLVACHHGKVRMTIQPQTNQQKLPGVKRYARGVWEGDEFPKLKLKDAYVEVKAQTLSLACMTLGDDEQGESWTAQAIALLDEYGPFRLAFLETLIRVADWRASGNPGGTDA